jgi:glycerol transport system permease protein
MDFLADLYNTWVFIWGLVGFVAMPFVFSGRGYEGWLGALAGLATGVIGGVIFNFAGGLLALAALTIFLPDKGYVKEFDIPLPENPRTVKILKAVGLIIYLLFLLAPLLWMLSMSFKTNQEILNVRSFVPQTFTLANYELILIQEPEWRDAFLNSLAYVTINTIVTLIVALPAAYAFSRYKFTGDNHLFFWLLTNRMAPGAVFLLPFFELYQAVNLYDTPYAVALAHTLFSVPLAIWILEGFMSGIPRAIDETAYIDGYSFFGFFRKIFLPLIRPAIGVAAFFSFLFSWVELLMARQLTRTAAKPMVVQLSSSLGAEGWDWGVIAAAGVVMIIPGALLIYFVRDYLAKGFAMGRV